MNMKQKQIKIEPRIKLNYNIDVNLDIRKVSLYGLKWFGFVFVLFFPQCRVTRLVRRM